VGFHRPSHVLVWLGVGLLVGLVPLDGGAGAVDSVSVPELFAAGGVFLGGFGFAVSFGFRGGGVGCAAFGC